MVAETGNWSPGLHRGDPDEYSSFGVVTLKNRTIGERLSEVKTLSQGYSSSVLNYFKQNEIC